MYKSRKYQANSLYDGDFSLCDVVLTKHAKRRCKERHIKPTRVKDACAIVKGGRYVITAWQKQPDKYGVHCTKGLDYMRKTNKNKVIPMEVLKHIKTYTVPESKPEEPRKHENNTRKKSRKTRARNVKYPRSSNVPKKRYVKWFSYTNHRAWLY